MRKHWLVDDDLDYMEVYDWEEEPFPLTIKRLAEWCDPELDERIKYLEKLEREMGRRS